MSIPLVQQNDVGVIFIITIIDRAGTIVNLSGATTMEFIFQRPDDTVLTGTAILLTDGTDGKIKYTVQPGDLSVVGTWKYQAHIVIGGLSLYSTVGKFKVAQNLPV